MKLTIKQLQLDMQERFDTMSKQIDHSTHDRYELHERADHILLNLERFKMTVEHEFREVRSELKDMRADITDMRADITDMRNEMRASFVDLYGALKISHEMLDARLTKVEQR